MIDDIPFIMLQRAPGDRLQISMPSMNVCSDGNITGYIFSASCGLVS